MALWCSKVYIGESKRRCIQAYIGETKRRLGTRLKVHKDARAKSFTNRSVIAEHAQTNYHPINGASTKILVGPWSWS